MTLCRSKHELPRDTFCVFVFKTVRITDVCRFSIGKLDQVALRGFFPLVRHDYE